MSEKTEGCKCRLHTGIIRQGAAPIHQELHVDNFDLLEDQALQKMYYKKEMKPEDWLKMGYVVDLPLSQEGSWLRVAVPNPEKETFFMRWIYIPYGSMLIRSMGLLHSGHYGSPGNLRYHATFTVTDDTRMNTKKLGHLAYMDEFKDWKLAWSATIPFVGRGRDGYRHIKCNEWIGQKGHGTKYFRRYIKCLLKHDVGKNIIKNMSPYRGLLKQPKTRRRFNLNGDDVTGKKAVVAAKVVTAASARAAVAALDTGSRASETGVAASHAATNPFANVAASATGASDTGEGKYFQQV
jgi:hypothetical protein